jgi:uncharacterized membrane protein YfcA
MNETLGLLITGLVAGVAAGFFGIGGGLVIVPSLVYLLGFSQHKATGTSLAVLLPPIGIAAVMEYHKTGNVDIRVAAILGVTLFLGSWASAWVSNTKIKGPALQLGFGCFAVVMGIYTIWSALAKMKSTP